MLIIPAIDLKDGCVVRYVQGERDKKIYSPDPLSAARFWAKQGAKFLHLVDLDGAFSGRPGNLTALKAIAKGCSAGFEFGGGLRSFAAVEKVLSLGAKRAVLGTRAIEDLDFLRTAYRYFKKRVIVSLDARKDRLAVKGWKKSSCRLGLFEYGLMLKSMGMEEVIYTDVFKDGMLCGPNIMMIRQLLRQTGLKVVASGGISKLGDLRRLKSIERQGVVGAIIGKALYEGRFTLSQALKLS